MAGACTCRFPAEPNKSEAAGGVIPYCRRSIRLAAFYGAGTAKVRIRMSIE
jgi:hypothetical protein